MFDVPNSARVWGGRQDWNRARGRGGNTRKMLKYLLLREADGNISRLKTILPRGWRLLCVILGFISVQQHANPANQLYGLPAVE
jgi:hypothetical protein